MGLNSARCHLRRPIATTLALFLGVASAHAADSYNSQNHQLTSPSLTICNVTYSDIVLTIGGILGGPAGTTANGSADTFNPAYNVLTVPAVNLAGGKSYFNVVASVSGLVSVASVSGADTYDGQNLNIASVQVGGTSYSGTVIKVGSIVSVGGGLPKGIRDLYNVESGQLFIPAVQDNVNGKVYTNVTVTVASILAIGTGGTPPACGSFPAGAMLTAAQVNAAAVAVQTYYQSLPHTSLDNDLSAVTGYMVQSGLFSAAKTEPGGISATLPDGMDFLEFADRLEDFCSNPVDDVIHGPPGAGIGEAPSARVSPAGLVCSAPGGGSSSSSGGSSSSSSGSSSGGSSGGLPGPANPHEIAFLVNYVDRGGAFIPSHQALLAAAWQAAGFTAPNYGVDVLDVTLENIAALGSDHPLDLLDIVTHGMVHTSAGTLQYNWLSDTALSDADNAQYATDLQTHALHYGGRLYDPNALQTGFSPLVQGWYTFSPQFVTNHASFNAGAIVDNQSCFGQSPTIAQSVQNTFSAEGAGVYMGWDNAVQGNDADQTDAFLFDRLLSEANATGLAALVDQRTPLQRPFPLTDIVKAMGAEVRSPVTWPKQPLDTYLQGAPTSDNPNPVVNFVVTPLAAASGSTLIEYSLPSISTMSVNETASGGTLTINGTFPAKQGNVKITDHSGTYPLIPSSWATNAVQVPLPPGGNGAAGAVQVFSVDGIASNPAPLTEWGGTLTWQESDNCSISNGASVNGTGSLGAAGNVLFRADVHPVVQTIDTVPVPQNFAFGGLMASSQATLTAFNAVLNDGVGDTATYSLASPAPTMVAGHPLPLSPGQFNLVGNAPVYLPASCNNGLPGPQSGPTNVFCPILYLDVQDPGSCTGYPCGSTAELSATFGWLITNTEDNGVGTFGTLTFTMDPKTYAVTVTTTPGVITKGQHFCSPATENVSAAGTINPPSSPPSATTPSVAGKPALPVPASVE